MRREYIDIEDRVAEIDTLLARFNLLEQHYGSDQDRLAAVIEAGTLFALEDGEVCPVCGAEPGHHRPEYACDGNVEEIVEAAKAETADVQQRATELKLTMDGLTAERGELAARAREVLPELQSVQASISREVPSVQTVRRETNSVIARKLIVQKSLDLVRRRDKLLTQRTELGVVPGYDSTTIVAQQSLNGTVLDSFCEVIEAELQAWEFPGGRRVFFELPKMDISVAGKSRNANGKGVRALLHGAFSIGLMKYCKHSIAFTLAFSCSNSLFVTYKDPDDLEDAAIQNTPLKDKAFAAFAEMADQLRLVVLDNVDVPDWLASQSRCIHFTGQPTLGRAGFFPSVPNG